MLVILIIFGKSFAFKKKKKKKKKIAVILGGLGWRVVLGWIEAEPFRVVCIDEVGFDVIYSLSLVLFRNIYVYGGG
jgi:hypothetical protein